MMPNILAPLGSFFHVAVPPGCTEIPMSLPIIPASDLLWIPGVCKQS